MNYIIGRGVGVLGYEVVCEDVGEGLVVLGVYAERVLRDLAEDLALELESGGGLGGNGGHGGWKSGGEGAEEKEAGLENDMHP